MNDTSRFDFQLQPKYLATKPDTVTGYGSLYGFTNRGLYWNGVRADSVQDTTSLSNRINLKKDKTDSTDGTGYFTVNKGALKADKATTITVAANSPLSSSAGAQDLSTNRTWTISADTTTVGTGLATQNDLLGYEPSHSEGNLTANSPVSLSATRQVIGGAAVISVDTTRDNPVSLPTRNYTDSLDALMARKATTMTIAANAPLSSSAGAQDLSANRTWTLSADTSTNYSGLATRSYVQANISAGAVSSVTGTAGNVRSNPPTGAVVVSLPDTVLLSTYPNVTFTTTQKNTNVSSVTQSQDTSAIFASFTPNTGKPLLDMVGATGNKVLQVDSSQYFGFGQAVGSYPYVFTSANNSLAAGQPSLVLQGTANKERISLQSFGNYGAIYEGVGAGGTVASPTASAANNILVGMGGQGFNNAGTPANTGSKGLYTIKAAENFTTSAQGTYHTWETTLAGGTTRNEKMRLFSNGHLGLGTTTDNAFAYIVQGVSTSGSPTAFRVDGGAHTTLAASTEAIGANFNFSATKQFATGALATQREVVFQAPTYGFVGASTITDAATLALTGAPIAGTNATITNKYAFYTPLGKSGFLGGAIIGGATGSTTITDGIGNNISLWVKSFSTGGSGMTVDGGADYDGSIFLASNIANAATTNLAFYDNTTQKALLSYDGTAFYIQVATKPIQISATGGVADLTINTSSNLDARGKISTYNNVATEGYGVPAIVDTVVTAGRTASIGTTNFTNSSTAGYYRVSGYGAVTAGSVGGTIIITIGWTDAVGATTVSEIGTFAATTTGRSYFTQFIQNAGANITYATTVAATPTYNLYFTVERLN